MCDNGKSFVIEVPGLEVDFDGIGDGDVCQVSVACGGAWDIKDEFDEVNHVTVTSARCVDGLSGLGYVGFFTGNKATVWAFESESLEGRFCYGPVVDTIEATPAQ